LPARVTDPGGLEAAFWNTGKPGAEDRVMSA